MQIEQKQELVQALINFFESQCDSVRENLFLSNLAYFELKTVGPGPEIDMPTQADFEVLIQAFDNLSESTEKFEEILSLLQFELEADFDHLQLFNALKSFVGDDEVRLAQLEMLFDVGTIH